MARWNKTCNFTKVRDAIDEGNRKDIISGIISICERYAKEDWEFADDFEELKDDVEVSDIEDDEDMNYWLDEFYNLCDSAKVWLS